MKNKKLFDETINILVNAYQKDKLTHGSCYACAVGNIIEAKYPNFDAEWGLVFYTEPAGFQNINLSKYTGGAKKEIDSSGYSLEELRKIEFAFETSSKGNSDDEWMFNGLMSVIDTLMIIHEADQTETEYAKSLFVKETA